MSITINLSGPEGNAFSLLARAASCCKQLGRDYAPIAVEMKSGDYNHLVSVFEREFGEYVTIIREEYEDE